MSVYTFTTIINQILPEPHAGLLSGILFGTKAALSKDLTNALITTGTLHIVALSGQNISILTGFVNATLLHVVNKRIASLCSIFIILGFVWFVGPSPSVNRAAIMGTLSLLAIVLGRQQWSLLFFFMTVVTMLLFNFSLIGDISFQLSAGATLGILLYGGKKPIVKKVKTEDELVSIEQPNKKKWSAVLMVWSYIEDGLRVTLSAQLFTIPIIFFTFGRLSLISPLSNVLIGWTIPIIMEMGFIAVILGWMWIPLGQIFGWILWVLLDYLIIMIDLTSRIPFASIGR